MTKTVRDKISTVELKTPNKQRRYIEYSKDMAGDENRIIHHKKPIESGIKIVKTCPKIYSLVAKGKTWKRRKQKKTNIKFELTEVNSFGIRYETLCNKSFTWTMQNLE